MKWTDAWEERFYGNPNSVITEIKGGKTARVEVYCETEKNAESIQEQFGGSVRELKSRDWVAMSAPKTEPLMIRDRLVISQIEVDDNAFPGKDVIVVPPEMDFGTGDHPTTATCLRLLVDHSDELEDGWSYLDLGTGSGVLAMAGKMLGAGEVQAFDFDGKAVEVAALNMARNKISEIEVFEDDVFTWKNTKRFQVITANLFSTVLIEALPLMAKWIKGEGRLILSGILAEQWLQVLETAENCEFKLLGHKKIGKWVSASFSVS